MSDNIKADAGDVSVVRVREFCADCNDAPLTDAVMFNMRNTGRETELMRGCKRCCDKFAARLRESLPEAL